MILRIASVFAALFAMVGFAPIAAAHPDDAKPVTSKLSQEALQTLAEARKLLAAGKIELKCLPYRPFDGSDSCETLLARFPDLEKLPPVNAAVVDCVPRVCRTAFVGYRRDRSSSFSVFVTLKPIDASGVFRIAGIEVAEGADTSD